MCAIQLCRGPGVYVGTQRPGRLGIAHTPEQVGHVFEHICLVDETVSDIDLGAVQADRGPPSACSCRPCRNDDVGIEVAAGFECDTGGVEVVDVVVTTSARPAAMALYRSASGSGTSAVPRGCTAA